jgi:N-acetylglucosaminyl-diphospho-decaprenol L-rhamnosyltransferase
MFSVVIVNYASWPLTARCVESLRETGYEDFEVVVVDNDCVEPPELPSGVRLIRNPENLGFARASNRGIAASSGELVVLINPDSRVEKGFFEKIEAYFEEDRSVGIAGPRVLEEDGELQLTARREISLASGLLGRTSLLTRLFPKSSLVKSQFPAVTSLETPTRVDWVSGACMVVRRRVLERVGAFDERFFMYFEDADLCRRAREAGWSVVYLPHVEVVHEAGGSSRSRPRAIWLLHKSAFLYHRKHGAHGPLNLFSLLVLMGLSVRALAKLISYLSATLSAATRSDS